MKKTLALSLLLLAGLAAASAGPNYQLGVKITRMTATTEGLMIMIDKPLPDNAAGSSFGWLLIRQEHPAIIEAALLAFTSNKTIDVYTRPRGSGSVSMIDQIDLLSPTSR